MTDPDLIDGLLAQVVGSRVGYLPAKWPRRLYDLVERTARASGMDPELWLTRLAARNDESQLEALVDAATIGHTAFFRHPEQFEELRKALAAAAAGRRSPIKVWCAGCSTGEEAYSVALTADEAGVPVAILATDVNAAAIRVCRAGKYSRLRTQHFPADAEDWIAPAHVYRMIRFEIASIVGDNPALGEGPFDFVFCRNVLIYFDRDLVPEVLDRLAAHLRPSGTLIVSPADAVLPVSAGFVRGDAPGWLRRCVGSVTASHLPKSVRLPLSSRLLGPGPASNSLQQVESSPVDRAARLLGAGQPAQAEAVLTELLNVDTDNMEAWFLLGEALVQRQERAQARAAFARASRCTPREACGVDAEMLKWAATRRAEALLDPKHGIG